MAGDWIKMRVWIARDPKVIAIADFLATERAFMDWLTDPVHKTCDMTCYEHVTRNVTVSVTVTALLQVWGIANDQGKPSGDDLLLANCTLETIDEIAGVPRFGWAMESVGWAREDDRNKTVTFPKFLEHNVPADDRKKASAAERQRRFRQKSSGNRQRDNGVTVTRDMSRNSNAREEKRREENNTPYKSPNEDMSTLPCHNPDLHPIAKRIVEHYREVVKTTHPVKPETLEHLIGWLLKGRSEDELKKAADGYAAHCQSEETHGRHRMSAAKFFESEVTWEPFLSRRTNGAPTDAERIDAQRLRTAELDAKLAGGLGITVEQYHEREAAKRKEKGNA